MGAGEATEVSALAGARGSAAPGDFERARGGPSGVSEIHPGPAVACVPGEGGGAVLGRGHQQACEPFRASSVFRGCKGRMGKPWQVAPWAKAVLEISMNSVNT